MIVDRYYPPGVGKDTITASTGVAVLDTVAAEAIMPGEHDSCRRDGAVQPPAALETLEVGGGNPDAIGREIDWVIKYQLIERYRAARRRRRTGGARHRHLRSQDHSPGPRPRRLGTIACYGPSRKQKSRLPPGAAAVSTHLSHTSI
jgi:hypothetical protein